MWSSSGKRFTAAEYAAVLAALTMAAAGVKAQAPRSATDEQVRPVFLYQLAQYVTWPGEKATTAEVLRFCIMEDAGLAELLATVVRGKSIQGRPLAVSKVKDSDPLADCHLVFVGLTKKKTLREFLGRWTYPPVLLVGEAEEFAELGGMVNLKVDGGRVSFEINLESTERAGLTVRSQLLRLARIVGPRRSRP